MSERNVGTGPTSLAVALRETVALRVLVLDPEVAVAEAVTALLADIPYVRAVEPTNTAGGVHAALATDRYDVLLIEPVSTTYDGPKLVAELSRDHPDLTIIAVSAHEDPRMAAATLRAGAISWVPKSTTAYDLMGIIKLALAGTASIPPHMLGPILRAFAVMTSATTQAPSRIDALTARERDVLDAMVEGLSRKEIADRLYLSVNTVRTHVQHVLAKLRVHTALEAVAVARQFERERAEPRGWPRLVR